MRPLRIGSCRLVGLVVLALGTSLSFAADHAEAPLLIGNPQQDINDIYAFQSPADSRNVVLIMTVNPEAGVTAPETLDANTIYEFLIDTDGDAREDINFELRVSRPNGMGQQNVLLQTGRTTLARGRTDTTISVKGGGKLFVGVKDDPFFFDSNILALMPDGMNNFGPNEDVTAIVLEIPRQNLGADNVGVWGITERLGQQTDRMGRPGIASVTISPGEQRNLFNQGHPVDDPADFRQQVIDNILGLNAAIDTNIKNDEPDPDAAAIADILLPDILTVDTSNPAGFLNGRRLEDDVIDAELNLLTNGEITTDNVPNDSTFSNTFPYLGAENNTP